MFNMEGFLELQIQRFDAVKAIWKCQFIFSTSSDCWHHFLIVNKSFSYIIRDALVTSGQKLVKSKICLHTLISELTGLHLETVRNTLKNLRIYNGKIY